MTNETANGGLAVTDRLCEEFTQELSQGQELWNQTLTWLTDKGLTFAIRQGRPALQLLQVRRQRECNPRREAGLHSLCRSSWLH